MGLNVVNNIGTNYSLYYNALDYFKTIMVNHPGIEVVTQGDIFDVDTEEYPAYPIGNILITNAVFNDSVTRYTCQLIVADKTKLKNNESVGIKNAQVIPFYGTDDVVDIHANTLAIINDLTSFTQRSVEAFEINGDIDCTPFRDNFDNGLAGWVITFNLKVFNSADTCLFNLYP
jgi:hypothetical protein